MSRQNFRLPSLQLGTAFDGPIIPLEVPGVLGRGTASALCILDGANRAPHRLSRMVRPVGLLGVKLAEPGAGVRVTLRLLADDVSTVMWDRHVRRLRGTPLTEGDVYVPSDLTEKHRMVELTAQGRSRALAMLALRRNDDGTVRQHVSFEIGADEIGESGLVMIGVENPAHAPVWSRHHEIEDSPVGVCVARMFVEPIEKRVTAHVSTGRPTVDHVPISAANPGFFVLNPPADGGAARVTITSRGAGGERLLGRRAKVKHPLRYVRETVEDRRTGAAAPAELEVVDLSGATVLASQLQEQGDSSYEFTVPAGAGPVFVRARKLLDGGPRLVNWSVRVGAAS